MHARPPSSRRPHRREHATRGRAAADPGRVFWVLGAQPGRTERRVERLARRAERLGTGPLALPTPAGATATGRASCWRGRRPRSPAGRSPPWSSDSGAGLDSSSRAAGRDWTPALCRAALRSLPAAAPPRGDVRRVARATRRLRQVGSGCLRDFLGGHDPRAACAARPNTTCSAQRELRSAAAPPWPDAAPEPGVVLAEFAAHAAQSCARRAGSRAERARDSGQTPTADAALRSLRRHPTRPTPPTARSPCGAGLATRTAQRRQQLSDFEGDAVAVAASTGCSPRANAASPAP